MFNFQIGQDIKFFLNLSGKLEKFKTPTEKEEMRRTWKNKRKFQIGG